MMALAGAQLLCCFRPAVKHALIECDGPQAERSVYRADLLSRPGCHFCKCIEATGLGTVIFEADTTIELYVTRKEPVFSVCPVSLFLAGTLDSNISVSSDRLQPLFRCCPWHWQVALAARRK